MEAILSPLRHAKRWITLDRFSWCWSRAGAARAFFLRTDPDECFAFALRTNPDEGFQKLSLDCSHGDFSVKGKFSLSFCFL